MLRKLNSASKAGFTLVEIMIVIAIIALLASIAVPNFLRARKRSQATALLEDLRIIDAAKGQYAIENHKIGTEAVTWTQVTQYIKPGSRLAAMSNPVDVFQNAITLTTIDGPPKVHADTIANFNDVISDSTEFWGTYKP